MTHPILGDITRENDNGDGVAHVPYGDRTIEVRIIADEIPYEATVNVAASVVQHLPNLDTRGKQVAASGLTEHTTTVGTNTTSHRRMAQSKPFPIRD